MPKKSAKDGPSKLRPDVAETARVRGIPKRPVGKPEKLRPDAAETAFRTMLEATGQRPKTAPPAERPKNTEAVRRGRLGGRTGGKARKDTLSPDRRSAIAKAAAEKRWQGRDDSKR